MFHGKPWEKASVGDAHFRDFLGDRNSYFLRKHNITIDAHRLLTRIFHHNPNQRLSLQEFRDALVSMSHFFVSTTEALNLRRRHCESHITRDDQLTRIRQFVKSQCNRKCTLPRPAPSPRNDPYFQAILHPSILATASPKQQLQRMKIPHPSLIADPLDTVMDQNLLMPPTSNCAAKFDPSLRTPPLSHSCLQDSHSPSGSSFASVILQTPEQHANQNTVAISQLQTEIDLGCPFKLSSGPQIIIEATERIELDQSLAEKTCSDPDNAGNGSLDICTQAKGTSSKRNVLKRFAQSIKGVTLLG